MEANQWVQAKKLINMANHYVST